MNRNPKNGSSRRKEALIENPKGIPQQSPGLRAPSYPGKPPPIHHNPERVAAKHEYDAKNGNRHNPVGVEDDLRTSPRVAPSSQPWAELHNHVGIELQRPPSSLSRGFFQRLRIDLVKSVRCCNSYARIWIVQQLQQRRDSGTGLFSIIPEHFCRPMPEVPGVSKPSNHSGNYESRFNFQIIKRQRSRPDDTFLLVPKAFDQDGYRRTGIRPHRINAQRCIKTQLFFLMVGQHNEERRQCVITKESQCQNRSYGALGCGFYGVHDFNKFWDRCRRYRTKVAETRDCELGTKLLRVGEFPGWLNPMNRRVHELVKFGLPVRLFVPNPLQQIRDCVGSNMTDSFLSRCGEALVKATSHTSKPKSMIKTHPLTQLLPPILRLRRGPQDQRKHTNQHPNPNQNEDDASSLFHGPTIMRQPKSESKLPHSKRYREFVDPGVLSREAFGVRPACRRFCLSSPFLLSAFYFLLTSAL